MRRLLQDWEGCIISVGSETFWARLLPIVGEGPEQEAEIYLSYVLPEDKESVKGGALFSWIIRSGSNAEGPMAISELHFHRLPSFTAEELAEAECVAAELAALFEAVA